MLASVSKTEPEPAPATVSVPDSPKIVAKETVRATPRKEPPLTMEQTVTFARRQVQTGSYNAAITILTPVMDSPERTWEAYLLMGMAHLGLDELGPAGDYLDKGIAVTEKQPSLWLQRAIVEQEKGEHEKALLMLRRGENIAPTMPELQLNIGYSHDVLGNAREAQRAYSSFIDLTDNKPKYMENRRKVQERLLKLGR